MKSDKISFQSLNVCSECIRDNKDETSGVSVGVKRKREMKQPVRQLVGQASHVSQSSDLNPKIRSKRLKNLLKRLKKSNDYQDLANFLVSFNDITPEERAAFQDTPENMIKNALEKRFEKFNPDKRNDGGRWAGLVLLSILYLASEIEYQAIERNLTLMGAEFLKRARLYEAKQNAKELNPEHLSAIEKMKKMGITNLKNLLIYSTEEKNYEKLANVLVSFNDITPEERAAFQDTPENMIKNALEKRFESFDAHERRDGSRVAGSALIDILCREPIKKYEAIEKNLTFFGAQFLTEMRKYKTKSKSQSAKAKESKGKSLQIKQPSEVGTVMQGFQSSFKTSVITQTSPVIITQTAPERQPADGLTAGSSVSAEKRDNQDMPVFDDKGPLTIEEMDALLGPNMQDDELYHSFINPNNSPR